MPTHTLSAERDNWTPSIEVLQKAGASPSAALHRERHGALIKEARQLEQKQQQDKEELMKGATRQQQQDGSSSGDETRARPYSWFGVVAALGGVDQEVDQTGGDGTVRDGATTASAHHAQSHMKDGMNALNERGQKINQLSDKTGDLENNASEYKSMAEQMRKKLEKQNKGLNFLNPFLR
jgi:Synaptobrevin